MTQGKSTRGSLVPADLRLARRFHRVYLPDRLRLLSQHDHRSLGTRHFGPTIAQITAADLGPVNRRGRQTGGSDWMLIGVDLTLGTAIAIGQSSQL